MISFCPEDQRLVGRWLYGAGRPGKWVHADHERPNETQRVPNYQSLYGLLMVVVQVCYAPSEGWHHSKVRLWSLLALDS